MFEIMRSLVYVLEREECIYASAVKRPVAQIDQKFGQKQTFLPSRFECADYTGQPVDKNM